jgi:glycosyltransferase involved in cell wall biosynthesis
MSCDLSVDVCLATYNGAPYIGAQIESIRLQLPENGRIIVADDGSSDDTVQIINSFNDERIIMLNGPRKGVIRNFEFLLKSSTADLIFLCDQDDIWLPNRILSAFKNIEDYDVVVCNGEIRNADLTNSHMTVFEWRNSGNGLIKNLYLNSFVGCCMCIRREVLDLVLPFPRNIPMHDAWIGVVATCFYRVKFDPIVAVWYRRHEGNVTSIKSNSSNIKKIETRLILLSLLFKLFYRAFKIHLPKNQKALK